MQFSSTRRDRGWQSAYRPPSRRGSPDWRGAAACADGAQDMVVELDPADEHAGLLVGLAKKVCADCPVRAQCLAAAEKIGERLGHEYTQGVWGGLLPEERGRLAVLGWQPSTCPECGLAFVRAHANARCCQACAPQTRLLYDDYRPAAIALREAGLTIREIAARLRLDPKVMYDITRRWGWPRPPRGTKKNMVTMECGTLAAKTRHHRKGDTTYDCACRQVPWKRGTPRVATPAG